MSFAPSPRKCLLLIVHLDDQFEICIWSLFSEFLSSYSSDMLQLYFISLPSEEFLQVIVELTVQSITEISEFSSSFKADVWFSQIWRDPRLDFTDRNYCIKNISLAAHKLPQLWSPNVCFVNSKKVSSIHFLAKWWAA